MKHLKLSFALLGILFCVSFLIALCGSTSTQKNHDSLHEASSTSFIENQLVSGSAIFSYDSEFPENDFSSSFSGLIHFDSDMELFTAPSVDAVCILTEYSKQTNIPLYLLYHSQKTHLC